MANTKTLQLIMSGDAGGDENLRAVVTALRDRGHTIVPRVSWEHGQAEMFVRKAADSGVDTVVACGGDGTLHEVINGAMTWDTPPVVAGLPYGTGNDFLDSIGVEPRDGPQQLHDWLDQKPTAIDLGRRGGRYFLNMATAGAAAEVTSEASHEFKDVAGSFAYFARAIPAAFDLPVHTASIEGPDLQWQGQLAFLFVGNGRQAGGGWTLCPAARLDDGQLDVVIVPEMPIREMARRGREMVKAATTGDFGPIVYRQVQEVSVAFRDQTPMNLDGEPLEGREHEFSVVAEALPFLLP